MFTGAPQTRLSSRLPLYLGNIVRHSASYGSAVPICVQAYVEEIAGNFADEGRALVSLVLLGSAVIGGGLKTVSDVDLILVVPDTSTEQDKHRFRNEVERVEILHQFRTHAGHTPVLEKVPVAPIRRLEVFEAFFGLFSTALQCAAIFPLHPSVTRHVIGVLIRSPHNCFFCYELRRASLEEELSFLEMSLSAGNPRRPNPLMAPIFGEATVDEVSQGESFRVVSYGTNFERQIPGVDRSRNVGQRYTALPECVHAIQGDR